MIDIKKLIKLSNKELDKLKEKYKIDKKISDRDIFSAILQFDRAKEKKIVGHGELEILSEGYGFLRNSSVTNDIYISASQVKKLGLRRGDFVVSEIRKPLSSEKNYAILNVLLVNNEVVDKSKKRESFDNLEPHYPDKQLVLGKKSISCRFIDLISPIGRGQRALVVAPPKAGKTTLISEMANGIIDNNKDVEVWILLVDERPEEVTDIKANVKKAKVFYSTFDEDPKNHIKVTEMVLEKAKREVEYKKHIVILMDNITRLARSYNMVIPSSGKIISGGLDPYAFVMPKRFFGAARNIKKGGSLTIVATALVDTGSRMDDIIYEEFKGTGNSEVTLDRSLSELRIFPAINVKKSGTRREELFFKKGDLEIIWNLRRYLASNFKDIDATKKLIKLITETTNNKEILNKFKAKK